MEPRLIDGQSVLVPVVHPARGAASAQRAGATVFGGALTRISGIRIDNRGRIEGEDVRLWASERLSIAGGSLSGARVDLFSGGDLFVGAQRQEERFASPPARPSAARARPGASRRPR